jgi:minor histocompatibility antigen H13
LAHLITNCKDDPTTKDIDESCSLLGLGDIVIPGLFIAILMRYDAVRAQVNPKGAEHSSFPKHFFWVNLVAYALGLCATVFVMYYFKAAQPALLYLVPACLGASLLSTAVHTGSFKELMDYSEEPPATPAVEEQKKID